MASCNSCSGEVDPGARFCNHCGSPMASAETGPSGAGAAPQTSTLGAGAAETPLAGTVATSPTWYDTPNQSSPQPKPKPLWRNPVSLAVVGVVIIAVVAAVLILSKSSNGAQSTASAAIGDLQSGNWSKLCSLVEPSEQAACNASLRGQSTASLSFPKIALASVVLSTSGNQATATITCTGASYCARFAGENATAQLVKLNNVWYLTGDFSSSAGSGTSGNSGSDTTPTTQNLGNSGNSGSLGNSGGLGNSGNSGLGNSGNSGYSGNSGNSGVSGTSGNSGSLGNSGDFGNSGNS